MSREDDFRARMVADATLMALLTGGVFTAGAVGLEGISRDATPAAFDADGYLKPCSLVRQRGLIPDGEVAEASGQVASASQVVELYVYQDHGYTAIDQGVARLYVLFQGYTWAGAFPAEWIGTIDRQRDEGALAGASLARMDWAVYSIQGA